MQTTRAVGYQPAPLREDDDRFVALAAEVGSACARSAVAHDRENTFVAENFELLREAGYLALVVPEDLGGLGATMRQACYAQAELARNCGSTALAVNMHIYATLLQCFRRRKGAPDAEGVLKRVAAEGIVIGVSGGSDWLWPTSTAVRDNGGFRVSGRKIFCSQAPAATVLATSATYDDPDAGRQVLHFSVPVGVEGSRIDETWDAMGMRGTGSHDVVLEDYYVPDDKIVGRRPYGEFGGPLFGAALHFAPLVASVYHGVATAARNEAVRLIDGKERGGVPTVDLPTVQRQVGLMDSKLRTSWWALMGAVTEVGDDYEADAATVNTLMTAKRMVVTEAVEVASLAMDVAGGQAYFTRCPLERLFRDVRAGPFHPFTPEATLYYAGRVALGGNTDSE